MLQDIFFLQNPWRNNKNYTFNLKNREILSIIEENIDNELILGLLGSRQVGKSSIIFLIIDFLRKRGTPVENIFYFNLDDFQLQKLFNNIPAFLQFIDTPKGRKFVFIDEVQRLQNPGLFLKQVFDFRKDIKIFYSGSSQLEVKAKTREHLVGRARIFNINRLSFDEYLNFASPITKEQALDNILLYGSYPAVAKESNHTQKILRIKDIFDSYIKKDLVDYIKLKEIDTYNKFLISIAMQSGDLLNIHSISKNIKVQRTLIEEYINILENTFVCIRIYPFYKNLSKEIRKTPKLYFLDLGLRNFVLNNFNSLTTRTDTGKLFENFYLTELLVKDYYSMDKINFWRTTNKTEVDFILHSKGRQKAIEVKWSDKKQPKAFKSLISAYPSMETEVVTRDRFL